MDGAKQRQFPLGRKRGPFHSQPRFLRRLRTGSSLRCAAFRMTTGDARRAEAGTRLCWGGQIVRNEANWVGCRERQVLGWKRVMANYACKRFRQNNAIGGRLGLSGAKRIGAAYTNCAKRTQSAGSSMGKCAERTQFVSGAMRLTPVRRRSYEDSERSPRLEKKANFRRLDRVPRAGQRTRNDGWDRQEHRDEQSQLAGPGRREGLGGKEKWRGTKPIWLRS